MTPRLRTQVWWTAAAVLFAAAGAVAVLAAVLHWLPCVGVSFDSAPCMDRQHDYRYYLPYDHETYGWQPVAGLPELAAGARVLTGIGWLLLAAGLPMPLRIRLGLGLLAALPLMSAARIFWASAGVAVAADVLAPFVIALGVLGVVVAPVLVGWLLTRAPVPVAGGIVVGALALVMLGAPVQILDYLLSSLGYASHDNPPFFGLLPGLWLITSAVVLAAAAQVRPHQPAVPGPPLKGPATAEVIQPP